MASQSWVDAILPCLGRSRQTSHGSKTRTKPNRPDHRPTYDEGLELARGASKPASVAPKSPRSFCGTTTIIVAEGSAPSSPKMPFRMKSASSSLRGPSSRKGSAGTAGRAKGVHQVIISAPTNFRKLDGSDGGDSSSKQLTSPLTYPSPSRTRPENMTIDRRDPSDEDFERPRTAPLAPTTQSRESFPFSSGSAPLPQTTWTESSSIPPVPSLAADSDSDRSDSEKEVPQDKATKRKPVATRVRSISNPTSPTFIPLNFAAEMLGSVPMPTEGEASDRVVFELEGTEIGSQKRLTRLSSSSLPSQMLARFSSRLSADALNMLSFFPTTPQLSKSPQPAPRLEAPNFPDYDITAPRPLFSSPRLISPALISPKTKVAPLGIMNLRLASIASNDQKSLPPTPKTAASHRTRFISIASGLELEDVPMPSFSPADLSGNKRWADGLSQAGDDESIHIFMSPSMLQSPDHHMRWN